MKTLKEYINENVNINEKTEESKSFTFDFTGMENSEDIIKSLTDQENVTVDGDKVTIEIKKDVNIDTVQDILQQSIQTLRKSQKSVNNEEYGQKTSKLEKTLNDMNTFIDEINNPTEEE